MRIQTCPNCNVQVGIGSDGVCPSCRKPTDKLENSEIANADKGKTDDSLQLWNPSAAANWSLLFTPAFGAYFHAANWTTLGDSKRAKGNRRWIGVTVAFLLFNILTIFFPTLPALDYVLRITSLGILIFWYFGTAKPQINFVKKKFGNEYKRRPWGMPFLAGIGLIGLYLAACVAISVRLIDTELPSCASTEVVRLMEQVIRSTSIGATVKIIDGHRELSYDRDANVRHGECIVHTDSKDIPVKFIVEWKDRKQGLFQVRLPGPELPSCTSTEVIQLLEQVIRSEPTGTAAMTIDGHRELSYDRDANVRYGECIAHMDSGDIPVKFIVEWQDRKQGLFHVRLEEPD